MARRERAEGPSRPSLSRHQIVIQVVGGDGSHAWVLVVGAGPVMAMQQHERSLNLGRSARRKAADRIDGFATDDRSRPEPRSSTELVETRCDDVSEERFLIASALNMDERVRVDESDSALPYPYGCTTCLHCLKL